MFFFSPLQAEKFLPKAYNSFAGEFSETRQRKWPEFDTLVPENFPEISGNNVEKKNKTAYKNISVSSLPDSQPFEKYKETEYNTTENKNISVSSLPDSQPFEKYKVLDIGCGNGRLRKFLEEKKFSGSYYARDVAENFLDHAKKNLREFSDTHFSNGGFLDLKKDFPKNYFNEVWAIASFHHLSQDSDRKKALTDIADILKPEGEIILTLWNLWEQEKYIPQKKSAFWRSVFNPLFSERDFLIPWGTQKTPRYYYSFSEKYITSLLTEAGFEIQKIFYSEKKQNLCIRAKKISRKFSQFVVEKIPFDTLNEEQTLQYIQKNIFLKKNKTADACISHSIKHQKSKKNIIKIYTPNPEMIVACSTDSEISEKFLKILQQADLSLADGNGILWASGLPHIEGKFGFWKFFIKGFFLIRYAFFRKKYPAKITKPICGSDIFKKFLEQTHKTPGIKIFLLGGEKGSAHYIQKKFSHITGIFDGMVNQKTLPDIQKKIQDSHANILFVALGAPKQETYIADNESFLAEKTDIQIAMGVGGSFDFISGHQVRAPQVFRSLGLEWLYRLIKHPNRAERIWNATGKFIALIGK